jgi:hypothetical protein
MLAQEASTSAVKRSIKVRIKFVRFISQLPGWLSG